MITFFSKWAQGVIVAIVITVIIEMILPDGNNKKYMKIILGLYVLYSILNPILNKTTNNINLDNIVDKDYYSIENTISVATINTKSMIEDVYKENIKKEIKTYILSKGFNVQKIEITIENEDENKYGIVKTIELSISPKDKQTITKVEPVSIKLEEGEEKERYLPIEDTMKEYLKNNYGTNINNIIINS